MGLTAIPSITLDHWVHCQMLYLEGLIKSPTPGFIHVVRPWWKHGASWWLVFDRLLAGVGKLHWITPRSEWQPRAAVWTYVELATRRDDGSLSSPSYIFPSSCEARATEKSQASARGLARDVTRNCFCRLHKPVRVSATSRTYPDFFLSRSSEMFRKVWL